MILEQVSLRNWRAYRGGGHHFSFTDGANLIVGPNESGKSTILEAVRRGLLDRHSSKGQEIAAVRPLGSSLGPEVQLIFRSGTERYKVVKRFLDDSISTVSVERNGEFQLDHEGDAADRFLRSLLLADDATRGTLRPEQRGLAQALWFLQSEEGVPTGRWSGALEAGLKEELSKDGGAGIRGFLKAAANSAQAEAVEELLAQRYQDFYTPTGRVKAKSELAELETTLAELELALEQRLAERDRAAKHREELQAIEEQDRSVVATLEEVAQQRQELLSKLEIETKLDEERLALERSTEEAERRRAETVSKHKSVQALDHRIAELDSTLRDAEEAEARLRISVREHRRSAERHARNWEDDLAPKLEQVRARIADLQAKQRIEQLELEVQRLGEQIDRRRSLEQEVLKAKARLEGDGNVDQTTWEQARKLGDRAQILRERVWAAGIRVALNDLPAGKLRFDPEPERDEANDELVIAQETEVTIEGFGSFSLRSADERLAEFDREARACREQLHSLLEKFDVEDEAGLRMARERTEEAERALQRAKDLHQEVSGDGGSDQVSEDALEKQRTDAAVELRELRERCPQSVLPGMEGWAERRTQDELRELEARKAALERSIKEEREAEQAAQQKSLSSHELLEKVAKNTAAGSSERTALRERLAAELEAFRDRATFERALAEASKEAEDARAATEKLRRRIKEEVEAPKRQLAKLDAKGAKAERQHRHLAAQRTDRRARLEEVGALSLDRQISDLEAKIESKRSRLTEVTRRAKATAVLKGLFEHRRLSLAHSWVEPVNRLVEEWMSRLSKGGSVGVDFDAELLPQGVTLEGHADPLPLASLSHGASEQLVVLLRLALGVVLSQDERQLVVLDDRLVNADLERAGTLAEIIGEVANSCQVVIATCREEAYEGLDARRLSVARSGGFLGVASAES